MNNYYISFGQVHVHSVNGKTFDKDCLALIRAETESEARDTAFKVFGAKWAFIYDEVEMKDMKSWYYSRGIFAVFAQDAAAQGE